MARRSARASCASDRWRPWAPAPRQMTEAIWRCRLNALHRRQSQVSRKFESRIEKIVGLPQTRQYPGNRFATFKRKTSSGRVDRLRGYAGEGLIGCAAGG